MSYTEQHPGSTVLECAECGVTMSGDNNIAEPLMTTWLAVHEHPEQTPTPVPANADGLRRHVYEHHLEPAGKWQLIGGNPDTYTGWAALHQAIHDQVNPTLFRVRPDHCHQFRDGIR